MAKIQAPVKGYTGIIAGIPFVNGIGETENKWAIQWFKRKGYKVIEEKKIGYDSLTVKELRAIAKEKGIEGYSDMKKGELIQALKG